MGTPSYDAREPTKVPGARNGPGNGKRRTGKKKGPGGGEGNPGTENREPTSLSNRFLYSVSWPGKDSDNDLLDKEWVWIHYGTAAGMKSEFPTLAVEDVYIMWGWGKGNCTKVHV